MSEAQTATPAQTATVYFIDDSATMREVIKIAFKKENIQVVTCPSVSAAIEQFGKVRPDVVISDVIMPDRDGYELCTYVKQHAELGATPVILMSGVVNRTVAEKATVVKADELLRKPFQPHELVGRVKKLLRLDAPAESAPGEKTPAQPGGTNGGPAAPANGRAGLGDLFSAALTGVSAAAGAVVQPSAAPQAAPAAAPAAQRPAAPQTPRAVPAAPAAPTRAPQTPPAQAGDARRLRLEIQRLELLVKKLQSELEAERQYCQALEAHIRALQGVA